MTSRTRWDSVYAHHTHQYLSLHLIAPRSISLHLTTSRSISFHLIAPHCISLPLIAPRCTSLHLIPSNYISLRASRCQGGCELSKLRQVRLEEAEAFQVQLQTANAALRQKDEVIAALRHETWQQADLILEFKARLKQKDNAMAVQTVRNEDLFTLLLLLLLQSV
jgi:hypothetical protein